MLNYQLIKSILSESWAIDPMAIDTMSPLVAALFTPNMAFEASEPEQPSARSMADASTGGTKMVRAISIRGSLTKYDQSCGPVGMMTIGQWIRSADRDPAIDSIVLRIDSPGGTVSGTEDLANIIKETSKPIVAFVEDMACSAAYWLASCCDEVIANNSTAQVGSIGVLMSFADAQPMWEAKGVKFHTVTAPQSTDKTAMFEKVRSGDYKEYKDNVLAPLAQKFIDTVKGNRSGITDADCTGKVFFAKDATGTFVDSIGSFDFALQRAASLASGPAATENTPKILNMSYKRLAKVASVEAFESVDGTITLTGEMAQAVETALDSAETDRTNLEERTRELNTANTRVQTLEARVAELEGAAGTGTATVITDTDNGSESGETTFWDRLGACQDHLNRK
jgi:protease-4